MPTHNSYAFLLCVVGVYYTPNTKKTFNYHICLRGLVGVGIDGIYIYIYTFLSICCQVSTFIYISILPTGRRGFVVFRTGRKIIMGWYCTQVRRQESFHHH